MGRPKGSKNRAPIGGGSRRDADVSPVVQNWKTDHTSDHPGFKRQFMRENEVADRGRSKVVHDRRTGENVRVAGWSVVAEADAGLVRERPDLAAPIDTVARMGPHVLMEIPDADWELLQHEKDAVPDALANRLMRGQASEDVGSDLVRFRQEQYAAHPALMGGRAQTQG